VLCYAGLNNYTSQDFIQEFSEAGGINANAFSAIRAAR
jgi:hypothetical protein